MYLPDHFKEVDPAEIASIIAGAPLACVVANSSEGLVANHVPLMFDKSGDLIGHFAIANDMHRTVADGQEVMAIFRGLDGYISPNSYPSKLEHHRHVPTWNYQVVHIHGIITFQHDERSKRAAIGLLTRDQERRVNGDRAWRMADAPADYMLDMIGKIVALRISVTRTIAKSKLSQNRDQRDFDGAVEELKAHGDQALAERMVAKRN
ncbi:FMN-binding negative transcriptional regulator [Devosia sp. 2618]|uniref:FMN-binding negative transcriptional regulator n=1 Tax=Devosia sp. 2618 TaxID=3156454 RepID=UPI00339ABAE1